LRCESSILVMIHFILSLDLVALEAFIRATFRACFEGD
jgi:hypothetical protein